MTLSNLTRSKEAPLSALVPLFCASQSSFRKRYLKEPWSWFVPDLEMTLTTAPWARPYSAEMAEVETLTSWIASKL